MSIHLSPNMQDIVENKWEKYNLNGMEEFADKIYTGILPAEKNVMAGNFEFSLPFEHMENTLNYLPTKKDILLN